jgi:hypothetical protein
MKRVRLIAGIAFGLLVIASFVASYLQPSPEDIARQHCTEQGVAAAASRRRVPPPPSRVRRRVPPPPRCRAPRPRAARPASRRATVAANRRCPPLSPLP